MTDETNPLVRYTPRAISDIPEDEMREAQQFLTRLLNGGTPIRLDPKGNTVVWSEEHIRRAMELSPVMMDILYKSTKPDGTPQHGFRDQEKIFYGLGNLSKAYEQVRQAHQKDADWYERWPERRLQMSADLIQKFMVVKLLDKAIQLLLKLSDEFSRGATLMMEDFARQSRTQTRIADIRSGKRIEDGRTSEQLSTDLAKLYDDLGGKSGQSRGR